MADGTVTENPLVRVLLWLSGLVTVTLRVPSVAVELMVMLAVSCVAELKVHEFTVIPAPKLQVAPLWKFVPTMTTLVRVWPCAPLIGVTEVMVGAGATAPVTVKALALLPLWASTLVIVTVRAPVAAVAPIVT